jgi:hypothetical protein
LATPRINPRLPSIRPLPTAIPFFSAFPRNQAHTVPIAQAPKAFKLADVNAVILGLVLSI